MVGDAQPLSGWASADARYQLKDLPPSICRYLVIDGTFVLVLVARYFALRVSNWPKVEAGPRVTLQNNVKPSPSYVTLRRAIRTSLLLDFPRVKMKG
jgi:hypothetical protein